MLKLIKTCCACPEQYDLMDGDKLAGYFRLRHGGFYAEAYRENGEEEIVYSASPRGDGCFYDDAERQKHMSLAISAVIAYRSNKEEVEEEYSENEIIVKVPISDKDGSIDYNIVRVPIESREDYYE
jgi:hypothetical protein